MIRVVVAAALVACGSRTQQPAPGGEPPPEPRGGGPAPRGPPPLAAAPAPGAPRSGDEASGFVGVLTPRSSAEVVSPFTSTVAELTVKLGDRVEKGQLLGRLDDRPLREELAIAHATLKAAQAEAAQASVAQRAAHNVLERERRAFRDNIVAEAQVAAAEFDERKAEMAVARSAASVEEQRARVAKLNAKLVDTTLVAPLAGKVALAYVQPGERVVEGQPVVRLISSDELFVKFAIPADKAGTLASGGAVDVLFETRGVAARGVVRHLAPELDPIAQMIIADADLVDAPAQLQAGMVCRIRPRDAHVDRVR